MKSISLVNFKGIRELSLDFAPNNTFIYGENGTGKTTLFDAFTWLLFGKDSTGRSDSNFNIKTLDENGKPILRLEHSVTGVLEVDGKEMRLKRSFVEKWVKPRGQEEEEMQGHKTAFSINDVVVSTKAEYDAAVREICDEQVFRMITNPSYFVMCLGAYEQKEMLLDMAGEISDEQVAEGNKDFAELLSKISGVSLAQYTREIAARKRAIKQDIESIPSNIETVRRLMPEEQDWGSLEKELAEKKKSLAEIDEQLADISKAARAEGDRKCELQRQINEKRLAIAQRESAIREDIRSKNSAQYERMEELKTSLRQRENEKRSLDRQYEDVSNSIIDVQKELDALREEFRRINAESVSFPDGAFECPTCHRPLEIEDIESKQREMTEAFNLDKSRRLAENKQKGIARRQALDNLVAQCNGIIESQAEAKEQIEYIYTEIDTINHCTPEPVNAEPLVESDSLIRGLKNDIEELNNQLSMEADLSDNTELLEGKKVLSEGIESLMKLLASKDMIAKSEDEIARLEEKRVASNQALADLEREEFVATEFQKAKDSVLMERINGMFSITRFSFVDEQLNGGEKLTCNCLVDGVPYADANNARKMNAGLDIINAICTSKGICAPIFIDNAESVNVLMPTLGQKVELRVSHDKELRVSLGSN